MKRLLITINFTDPTDKFWWDSGIKNESHMFDHEKQTIHEFVKDICYENGMELTYKGKPKGNVYRELKDGSSEIVGYMYRGKAEIHDRNMPKAVMVFWDVWVEIHTIEKFEFVDVEFIGEM